METNFDPSKIPNTNATPTEAEKAFGSSFNWVIILIAALAVIVWVWPKWTEYQAKRAAVTQSAPTSPSPTPSQSVNAEIKSPEVVVQQPPQAAQIPQPPAKANQSDDPWAKFKKE